MENIIGMVGINLFNIIEIPDVVFWIVVGAIVVFAIALIAWGFLKEVRKK